MNDKIRKIKIKNGIISSVIWFTASKEKDKDNNNKFNLLKF